LNCSWMGERRRSEPLCFQARVCETLEAVAAGDRHSRDAGRVDGAAAGPARFTF
jgi:hypothetical protein